MSRGWGVRQREIISCLEDLPPGFGVLVGDAGANGRRAAYRLAASGRVRLKLHLVDGRMRLVAYLS